MRLTIATVLVLTLAAAAMAQDAVYVPNFGASAKIIHVKPSARDARASYPREDFEDEIIEAEDENVRVAPLPQRRRLAPPPVQRDINPPLRRRPYTNQIPTPRQRDRFQQQVDLPPPVEALPEPEPQPEPAPLAKRSLLSAPPLSAEGPSPIKPTPRWRIGEKHDPVPQVETAPVELEKFPSPPPSESIPSQGIPANVPLPPVMMIPPTSEILPPE